MKQEKTISAKIADIIGFFMSLDKEDKKLVFRVLKEIMEKEE
tara:strand:+ start:165 stop:290 length:126 start_codon:yes stop_codon:yes gene_type:complete